MRNEILSRSYNYLVPASKKSLRPIRTKRCRNDYGRRKALNKEFERCCTFLAEMMEKYGVQSTGFARRFLKRMDKAA